MGKSTERTDRLYETVQHLIDECLAREPEDRVTLLERVNEVIDGEDNHD